MLNSWRDFCHCKVPIVASRVEDIVRRVSGPRVLEAGCNEGWVSKAIIEERGFEVIALDNRIEAVHQTQEYFGITAVLGDVCALPYPDGHFDCVVAGEILEHLPNPGKGLAELFRVSKGHVILTLPIGRYWNDEVTHAWQINGGMVEHERGDIQHYVKHTFVFEFRKIRELGPDGIYKKVNEGFEDR
jgi:ubiquinone/menaquinone biosynthesis C-methylase UbiE